MTAQDGNADHIHGWRRNCRIASLLIGLTVLIIVPFVVWGDQLDAFARDTMANPPSRFGVAIAGMLLLAADILLPTPSTLVLAGLGALFGGAMGTLIGAIGLTLSCAGGYWLGCSLGYRFAERTIGHDDLHYLRDRLARHGALVLAVCRPVPVLAEASVIVAGMSGVNAASVMIVTSLANIAVAATYAIFGASAGTGTGLLIAIAASLALPTIAILASKAWKSRTLHL